MKVIPREVEIRRPITWSKKIRELQEKLRLSLLQKEVLIGTLLGDGHLASNAYGKNYRLQIVHMDKHKGYVDWKYKIFEDWCLSKPKFQKMTNSWRFRTISHPDFTEFQKLFYSNKNKILPEELDKILNSPITLAVWFMDDGALGPGREGLTLNTQSFTKKENRKLMECLKINFGLKTSLHRDKGKWRLYILSASAPKFKLMIDEFVLPEFKYKLSYL